jgi:PPK2 family polyphosphate:nucleotide phosphotransferase
MMKTTFSPGTKIRLRKIDPADDSGTTKEDAIRVCAKNALAIDELAFRMSVEGKRAILILLQGMDAAGKDGVVRHVINAVNPQSCEVHSFKVPTAEERGHDFLWRHHCRVPAAGNIGIHVRSHYESVLVERVRKLAPKEVWSQRYELINAFEETLVQRGVVILKFFLHISRAEQRERLLARRNDPSKQWKLSVADITERKLWDDYWSAYDDALTRCNTADAPWHVIPADRKWHRDLLINRVLHKTLKDLDPQFPPPDPKALAMKIV